MTGRFLADKRRPWGRRQPILLMGCLLALCLAGCGEDSTSPPALLVDPTEIELSPADSAASVTIRNGGQGTLSWELSDDAPWLIPSATAGTTTDEESIDLTLERDSLDRGPTLATVTVSSNGGTGRVHVQMWTALETQPDALDLDYDATDQLIITNQGDDPLAWLARADQPWIDIAPPQGMLEAGQDTLTVSVVPAGLTPGAHTGWITIDAGALGFDSVQVTVTVPEVATVSGGVYFAATRIPIAGIIVSIGAIADTTDADGTYRLTSVPSGTRTLSVAGEGFPSEETEIEVPEAGLIHDLYLSSDVHTHQLTGRVFNNIGVGIPGASGSVQNPDGTRSELHVFSDAAGDYTLDGVPAGSRAIEWEHDLYEPLVTTVEVAASPTIHDVQLVARPVDPPWAPQGLDRERVGCYGVRIGWEARFEATAGGYHVERAPTIDGPFTDVSGLVSGETPSYLDVVPAFGKYYYRVRTENIDGIIGEPTDHEFSDITLEIWALLSGGGEHELNRYGHVTVHDPVYNRLIMFGGVGCEGGHCGDDFNDTWRLDLVTYEWELLDPGTGPDKRQSHAAIYDATRQRLVVFGGVNLTHGTYFRDTWAYDLSVASGGNWTRLEDGSQAPNRRYDHIAVYTGSGDDRMIVYGGRGSDGELYNDVWAFDLETHSWEQILEGYYGEQDPQPQGRYGHSGVYDPLRHRMVFYGGQRSYTILFDDAWALDLESYVWAPLPTGPNIRYAHAAVYDPVADRMLVYGGRERGDNIYEDLQALRFAPEPLWEEVQLDNDPGPALRYHHTLVHDATEDRLLLFGGIQPQADPELRPDTWAYCLVR